MKIKFAKHGLSIGKARQEKPIAKPRTAPGRLAAVTRTDENRMADAAGRLGFRWSGLSETQRSILRGAAFTFMPPSILRKQVRRAG